MIIAHRGYTVQEKENTIPAFAAAIAAGADAIETDVRCTRDGRIVVSHDDVIEAGKNRLTISSSLFNDVKDYVLAGDDLFAYLNAKKISAYIEVKQNSAELVEKLAERIAAQNAWDRIHLLGFSFNFKEALKAQVKYPKLRAIQLLSFPALTYLRKPKPSWGLFVGWLDGVPFSEQIFRTLFSPSRLQKFREAQARQGYNVMCGVLNTKAGIEFFKQAGFTTFVTDNVPMAVESLSG